MKPRNRVQWLDRWKSRPLKPRDPETVNDMMSSTTTVPLRPRVYHVRTRRATEKQQQQTNKYEKKFLSVRKTQTPPVAHD